jgi:hypothetical protein
MPFIPNPPSLFVRLQSTFSCLVKSYRDADNEIANYRRVSSSTASPKWCSLQAMCLSHASSFEDEQRVMGLGYSCYLIVSFDDAAAETALLCRSPNRSGARSCLMNTEAA